MYQGRNLSFQNFSVCQCETIPYLSNHHDLKSQLIYSLVLSPTTKLPSTREGRTPPFLTPLPLMLLPSLFRPLKMMLLIFVILSIHTHTRDIIYIHTPHTHTHLTAPPLKNKYDLKWTEVHAQEGSQGLPRIHLCLCKERSFRSPHMKRQSVLYIPPQIFTMCVCV